ncbi:MAG TPA: arginine--tRNA ligase, partial [Alphaproteobacteria bacterium]
HGDLATNVAMVLAKAAGKPPRALAEPLAAELRKHPEIEGAEIAGPGFINLRVRAEFWRARLVDVLKAGLAYGDSDLGQGEPVNVEYVSTNPTGLLHVGHARGSVFGDVLASLLAKAGHKVTREYYVNDAGKQVEALRDSFIGRLQQAAGAAIPDGAFGTTYQYPGEEIADAAKAALAADPAKWRALGTSPAALDEAQRFVVAYMMDRIREDLALLGVRHDVFTSERHDLVEKGKVDEALATLAKLGHVYTGVLEPPKGKTPDDWEPRPQTLFRATAFGDDVDRPLKKSDGAWTYFASDIAYHLDKFRRGFRTMIDVWGADHAGYVKRVEAAVKAVTDGQGVLDVKICQLVKFLERGEPVRMSKRAGNVITVRDVVERVGKDVMRLIMLTRKNDAPLDFDFAKVQEQSKDNPVFYIQYAHARCCSVFRQAGEAFRGSDFKDSRLSGISLNLLTDSGELGLIKALAAWPRTVEAAAEAHEPHRLAFYLYDVAAAFHGHWNRGKYEPGLRFIVEGNEPLTLARLALVRGVQLVIASGLHVIGVTPVEEMR